MYETKPYFYGTGRRKNSVARVRVYNGTGKITINDRDIDDYFGLETLKLIVRQPLASPTWRASSTSWSALPAAVFPARLALSATACPAPCCRTTRTCAAPEEGWLPDPRSSYEGAQEVRPQGCPSRPAVHKR